MSNYNHAKDLEGQVLTLIEAIVPEAERATAAKSIFRRLFHEWVEGLDVGIVGKGNQDPCGAGENSCTHTAAHPGVNCSEVDK